MVADGFGSRLAASMAERGQLCGGIDPHPALLEQWGLPDDARGLAEFAHSALEGFAGVVAAVKPQSAFYERHGAAGIGVLEGLLAEARAAGVLTILDVKRGDIGSTMDAYADAYLSDGSSLAADAVTVSPYLGFGSLTPAIEMGIRTGRGVFVLCLTSNPQGPEVQHARAEAVPVAASIAARAARVNAAEVEGGEVLGPVGLVIGATVGDAPSRLGIDLSRHQGPILAPGVGEQGAEAEDLTLTFGDAGSQVLAASSRYLLAAGPSVGEIEARAAELSDRVSTALSGR